MRQSAGQADPNRSESCLYLEPWLYCASCRLQFGGAILTQKRQKGRPVQPRETQVTFGPSANPTLTAAILEVVDTQLRENTPPQTRQTFDRLVTSGYTPEDARRLIGNIVAQEIFHVLQRGEGYNEQRYLAALHRLPDSAYE
jgi:hypothetical protein